VNRIDCVPDGLYTGLINIRELGYEGRIVPLPTSINMEYLYLPISKKSQYLQYLPQIEDGLKRLRDDGTIEKLINDYIEKYATSKTP